MTFRPAFQGQVPSLGYQLVEFIEHDLELALTDEQANRLVDLYRLDAATGRRVVRRAALRRPKGSGKSPEGGYIAYAELVGPVRFAGWSPDGQPIGVPHDDPWCQLAAVSEDQTDNVMVWLFDRLADLPKTRERRGIDLGRSRIYLANRPGRIEPVTAAAGSREGQRVTFAVLDQSESWTSTNGGRRLADVLRRNAGKMGGWTYELQNAPEPGDGSVADETAKASEKGNVKGVLFDSREAPEVPDFADSARLRAALLVSYGEASTDLGGWVDLDRLVEEIQDPATDPSDARRYYLNQPASPNERAFDRKKFVELAATEAVVASSMKPGSLIAVGFDGSRFDDATAIVACNVETGFAWLAGLWEKPDNAGDEWEVDAGEVTATISDLFKRYDVWRLYCDPPYWETDVAAWSGQYGKDKVLEWWTNRPRAIGVACRQLASAIRAGSISHDGEPDLVRHVGNAVRRRVNARDDEGRSLWTLAKDGGRKIDGAMALVLAWEARNDALTAGARRRGGRRGGGI